MGHAELVGSLEKSGSDGESLLKISECGLSIVVLIEFFLTSVHEFTGFCGHRKLVDGNGGGL